MKNKQTVNVFFACDANYIPHLTVALKSIMDHVSDNYKYRFYVLECGLDISYKAQLEKHLVGDSKIEFIDVEQHMMKLSGKITLRDYYTCATYYRFFVQLLFPNLDKALYLDSDIVVLDDVAKLYNFNLGNNLVGACRDEVLSFNPAFKQYADVTVGVHHMKYFNAGVLLMNLKEFRKQDIFTKFLRLMRERQFPVAQDQDYLNVLCKDQVRRLPLAWNKTPVKQFYFNDKDVKIAHFKMAHKPWKYQGVLYEEYFWKYAKQTEHYRFFLKSLENFTEEDARADREAGERLYNLVVNENKAAIKKLRGEFGFHVKPKTRYC